MLRVKGIIEASITFIIEVSVTIFFLRCMSTNDKH
jgi:hypothetical protein